MSCLGGHILRVQCCLLKQHNQTSEIWINVSQPFDFQSSSEFDWIVVLVSLQQAIGLIFEFWFAFHSPTMFSNYTLTYFNITFLLTLPLGSNTQKQGSSSHWQGSKSFTIGIKHDNLIVSPKISTGFYHFFCLTCCPATRI